jgi:hypothetical protein
MCRVYPPYRKKQKFFLWVYVSLSIQALGWPTLPYQRAVRKQEQSLVSEVSKWKEFNFACYSLLTSKKLDSRTAVLRTRTYRVLMRQLSNL